MIHNIVVIDLRTLQQGRKISFGLHVQAVKQSKTRAVHQSSA